MAVQQHDSPLSGPVPEQVPWRADCSACGKDVRVLKNGTIGPHNWRKAGLYGDGQSNRCSGWGKKPKGAPDAS